MEVLRNICDLCHENGQTKYAQNYYLSEGKVFDCCKTCAKTVKEAGYEVKKIQDKL
jgi:hypothetical protein